MFLSLSQIKTVRDLPRRAEYISTHIDLHCHKHTHMNRTYITDMTFVYKAYFDSVEVKGVVGKCHLQKLSQNNPVMQRAYVGIICFFLLCSPISYISDSSVSLSFFLFSS